jgi:hypothetical protein
MKKQATKANPEQVELHIERQKHLGERAIDDRDQPTALDLIVTAIVVAIVIVWFAFFKS